ncbi:Malate/lactate/ureidoglycolate dehydrogenase, LDH2 family [Devosia lucknowensis]|uniref:Malate/lactate/ureidoglycolate dehydrogenase, LDH2 family n=1 Tax=Devosia lucknowensis TaxID=1096929 RepID=A0A1Y6FK75_9HYPH|nr:Ldh family oxidoreductase [Devosia lucknowensis]SMQ72843.1 Malate/lactate/ureidoglycolate dehydrogenase, LDH2 family [Devosia lucknowensis]
MQADDTRRFPEALLRECVEARLAEAGASPGSRAAAGRAMLHASLVGVDSHGVRLAEHYCRMLGGGRLKRDPLLSVEHRGAGSAMVDGDDGLGHFAAYKAVEVGIALARTAGVGAVGVRRSSHLGAAGAYALAGAEQGFVTFATTNTDSMVALFDGAQKFHGTNPLAFAAPLPGERPWLLDMATSSIPLNRVMLHRSLDKTLPEGGAATPDGEPTTDPYAADMLLPLGGVDYGYKGAALAGVATLFSALLTGTTLDSDFIPMYGGDDISTPRNMGHFVLVIDPDKFAGRAAFGAAIARYVQSLRGSVPRAGGRVMAPGDREWAEMDERRATGIPVDPDTVRFLGL